MTVDLTKVSPLHDLLIGFYSGTATGAGFTSMTLDVKINGTDHINNFTTAAAHHNMVAAMASFGASTSGASDTHAPVQQDGHHTMFAAGSA
jgi:hypothetical protein